MRPPRPSPALLLLAAGCAASNGHDTEVHGRDTGQGDTGLGPPDGAWDVLVVGAGPAGLAAAWQAAASGASVVVFERETRPGGALHYAGSEMLLAGTASQVEAGVEDTPESLLGEWPSFTGGDPSDPWVQAFTLGQAETVHDWLEVDLAVPLTLKSVVDASSGSVRRLHVTPRGGSDVVNALVEALGADRLVFRRRVDGFARDEAGVVVGVTWASTDGDGRGWSEAGRVVLATGGYQRDLDRVRAVRPDLVGVDVWYACGPGADGNGHALLEGLGATWDNAERLGMYLHGTGDPRTPGEEVGLGYLNRGIWVDAAGARFTDESVVNSIVVADEAVAEADGVVWVVVDGSDVGDWSFRDHMILDGEPGGYTLSEMLESGWVLEADSVRDLAAAFGADPDLLEASVASFNAWARGEAPDPFRTGTAGVPPIETAPFYATRLVPATAKAFGGIEVDASGRVVDGQGDPIPGVLAAGELTGMAGGSIVGSAGFTGSLSANLLSGRIAGATAAAEALEAAGGGMGSTTLD